MPNQVKKKQKRMSRSSVLHGGTTLLLVLKILLSNDAISSMRCKKQNVKMAYDGFHRRRYIFSSFSLILLDPFHSPSSIEAMSLRRSEATNLSTSANNFVNTVWHSIIFLYKNANFPLRLRVLWYCTN